MQVKLTEALSRRTLLMLVSLSVAALALTGFQAEIGHLNWRVQFLVNQGQLEWENNAAVWISSVTFLTAGASALLCWVVDRRVDAAPVHAGRWEGLAHNGWLVVAIVFTLLSWDELGSLHERLDDIPIVSDLLITVPGVRAWAAVLLVPIATVSVGLLAFGFFHVYRVSGAFILLILGTLLLASIPFQEHVESGMREAATVDGPWRRPVWMARLEEGTELAGAIAFVAGHLTYLHRRLRASGVSDGSLMLTLSLRGYVGFGGLLLAGLAYVHIALPHLLYLNDGRGVPQNWFPAVAALAVGILLMALRAEVLKRRWALGLLAASLLVLSVDHAANFVWRDKFFATTQLESWVRTGVIYAVLAALVSAAISAARSSWFTVCAVVWGGLLFLSERDVVGVEGRVTLALLAHLCLGLGVMVSFRDITSLRSSR